VRRVGWGTSHEVVEKRHAYGQAVGHLLEDARLRAISHGRVNFETANHRSGMKDQRIRTRDLQAGWS
jgi:hypothetical protein